MLKYAKLHEEQARRLLLESAFDFHFKFGTMSVYREELKIPDSTWAGHHFVSLHGDQVIGYIAYDIDRQNDLARNAFIAHFEDKHPCTFGRDAVTAIKDIFGRFGLRKLNFSVVVGNPIEKCYDRLIQRYGGRIAGVRQKEVRLIDGQFYDLKMYEMLAENYYKATALRGGAL